MYSERNSIQVPEGWQGGGDSVALLLPKSEFIDSATPPTAIVAYLRNCGKRQRRLGMPGIEQTDITHGGVHQWPDLSKCVKRKICCGNAWRESRTSGASRPRSRKRHSAKIVWNRKTPELTPAADCGFNPTPRWIALPKLKAMVGGTKIVRRELGL